MRLKIVQHLIKQLGLLWLLLAVTLLSVILVSIRSNAQAETRPLGTQKLVTVYDQGEKQVVLTNRLTVGEALQQAKIDLSVYDRVEPNRESEIATDNFNINIYRAQPVIVVDGAKRLKIMSSYRSARQIVDHAGLDFQPEDEVVAQINFLASGDSMGVEYVIKRSKALRLTYYGKTELVRTQAKTVREFLQMKALKLRPEDRMNLSLDEIIADQTVLEIWREGKQELVLEEPLPFRVEQIQDFNRDVGFKEIRRPGRLGRQLVTYEIEIRNGQEASRRVLSSVVVEEARTQVEVIGMSLKYTGGGDKNQWLAAAGIPESMWGYADAIVQRESGWNPNAVNKRSGACGLAQALPCSKVSGDPFNPVNSLRWMDNYVNSRYGGWAGAYAFWQKNKWY